MAERAKRWRRDARTFLVLALLGALLSSRPVPPAPGAAVSGPAAAAAVCAATLREDAGPAPCPGCCATGTAPCCALSRHGDAPGSPGPAAAVLPGSGQARDFELPWRPVVLPVFAWLAPSRDLPRAWQAAGEPRPRSPARQRALGCLWLI